MDEEARVRVDRGAYATQSLPTSRPHRMSPCIRGTRGSSTTGFPLPASTLVRLRSLPSVHIQIAEGEFREAFDILTSSTPLMSLCAWVCNHPCEEVCTRGEKDEALRIRDLKRFLIERGKKGRWSVRRKVRTTNGKAVAVVGSGPAGLTAATLLAKAGYAVTIYERERQAGGMLRYALPAFRFPRAILDDEIELVKSLGVKFRFAQVLGTDVKLQDLKRQYEAVYLAIGASRGERGQITGADADGSIPALDFLKAVAEGKASVGRRVAVIGGGFTALDSARCAIRLGAEEVYILYRRTRDEMPASKEELAEAEGGRRQSHVPGCPKGDCGSRRESRQR